MKAVVKATGEILEFNPRTAAEIQETWLLCSEYIKAYEAIKDKLKPLVLGLVGNTGLSEPINGYQFRATTVQRMNYDKAVMRDLLDPDVFDVLLEPSKTKVDAYLKENLGVLGEASTILRQSMLPVGRPYQIIKQEKL